ncbi:hypothetical protein [Terribacillus saccharophilus]|uniref:hypothetical protein n=1 Tax=Terribacillus saccharophilus TaxID=361277 RepID=UPI002DC82A94|nr:hypothetical protein [Terribacillus saccharophilus]
MKRFLLFFIPLFLLATCLGIGSQDLAYWMQDHVYDTWPLYYVTAFSIMSIALYLITILIVILFSRKKKGDTPAYIVLMLFIAGPVSLWSTFVTLMWWG